MGRKAPEEDLAKWILARRTWPNGTIGEGEPEACVGCPDFIPLEHEHPADGRHREKEAACYEP